MGESNTSKGALQRKKKLQKSEITMEVGGWVGPGLTRFFFGKSSQNSPKPVLIFWSSIPCVFCMHIYTLLKVVGYYDFCVLSISVMGFQKKEKVWMRGGWVGGWGKHYPYFFGIFLTLQSP